MAYNCGVTGIMNNMDRFDSGLLIDEPTLFLPFNTTKSELQRILNGYQYKKITNLYWTMMVTLFDTHFCGCLGMHFDIKGKLEKMELFKTDRTYLNDLDVLKSFGETQKLLESYIGKPEKSGSTLYNLVNRNQKNKKYTWDFKDVKVIHSIWDRFGLEEHIEILIK